MSNLQLMTALAAFKEGQKMLSSRGEEARTLELADLFRPVARQLLFGGCFEVYSKGKLVRRVYPHTVEFYYHEESDGGLKDYIVYHRNKVRIKDGKATLEEPPYFEAGAINAHQSGIDITFESPEGQYRASALIRAFRYEKDGKEIIDTRSTYLYDHLFTGVEMPITIRWKSSKEPVQGLELYQGYRVNVFKYEKQLGGDGKPIWSQPKEPDRRPWAFSTTPFKEKLRYIPKKAVF